MNDEDAGAGPRPFPKFLEPWREVNGPDFTPSDYISQPESISHVIAAQWIFCPNFINYRGAIIGSDFSAELDQESRDALDDWFIRLDGDVSRVEAIGNLMTLPDVFTGADTGPYEEDLSHLAQSIARCWRGLLLLQFPEREFVVEVFDDWDEPYEPKVTFYTKQPAAPAESEPAAPGAVVVHDLRSGEFARVGNAPVSVHVDLPPSLYDDFAALAANAAVPHVVDVRSIRDVGALRDAIAPGAAHIADAFTRTPANTVLLTKFEQLWVKNRPVAEQFLAELPAALSASVADGQVKHVALADLASSTVDTVLERLGNTARTGEEPLPVFHYPPAA